ncbi:MAG TPA: hypothetical protein VKV27_16505 [Solirubrobacteraceae bacterium]|nr:hypothetical protein [Solirubrobacteraceae bacterium]
MVESVVRERCGLTFARAGGPIVAICGLWGGAGATTVACAVAVRAALESQAPVVLCELAARPRAADMLGVEPTLPLTQRGAHGLGLPAIRRHASGLHLIAPRAEGCARDHASLPERVTALARTHALTVLDTGAWGDPAATVACAIASHVIWVATAADDHPDRAQALQALRTAPRPAPEAMCVLAAGADREPALKGQIVDIATARCQTVAVAPERPGAVWGADGHLEPGAAVVLARLALFLKGLR